MILLGTATDYQNHYVAMNKQTTKAASTEESKDYHSGKCVNFCYPNHAYTFGLIADMVVVKSDRTLFKSDMAVFKSDFNT